MPRIYIFLFLVLSAGIINPAMATFCKFDGIVYNGANNSTVTIPVDMSQFGSANAGEMLLIDLQSKLSCKYDGNGQTPSNTDTMYVRRVTELPPTFTLGGITGIFKLNGSTYQLPHNGPDILAQVMPDDGKYYDVNMKVLLSLPAMANNTISINKNDLITSIYLMDVPNWGGGVQRSYFTMRLVAKDNATINVRTCSISTTATNVRLGNITPNDVIQSGKVTNGQANFNLGLNCATGTIVNVTPSGASGISSAAGVYKNLSTGSGAAQNVDVALECTPKGGTLQPMANGVNIQVINSANSTESLPCVASYYSNGNGNIGSVSSAITFVFSYN